MKVRAALSGLVAAAVALGVAELVAVITGARSAPLIAVGGAVIDAAPEPAKEFAISLFGVYDKLALLIGTAVLLAAFAAVIGVAARRNRRLAVAGIGVFAIVGVSAAVTRPGAGLSAALPTLVGSVVALAALFGLLSIVDREAAAAASPGEPAGAPRRSFLRYAVTGLIVAVAGGIAGRFGAARRGVQQARSAVELPVPSSSAPPVPPTADPPVAGLSRYITSNRTFYRIDTALATPQVDPQTWQLRVHGRVARPLTISYADLLARPMVERYVTLACVSNEIGGNLIGNARWLGVPVEDILAEAEPLPGADQVVSRSVDGWTCGTPTGVLRDGRDALLAVGMNGEPLPVEHGFPVRMVVPGLYGYVSACKWLAELELTNFADFDAYWVRKGWAARGPVKTQSRIDVPRHNATMAAGETVLAGVAWAQHRGITAVEVRIDDGPWQLAELGGTVGPDTWRQWTLHWQAEPGKHAIAVRAADSTGAVQPAERTEVFPDGATGWHTVNVSVT